jgi:hypothetical protein
MWNYPRYDEDLAIVAETLAPYGYTIDAIFADGVLHGRAAALVPRVVPASRQNVIDALQQCVTSTKQGEKCIIYVTDHGFVDATVDPYRGSLALWYGDTITDSDFFGALTGAKDSKMVLLFQQCEAGSFAFRHRHLKFEMAGAAAHGPSYADQSGAHDAFTGMLFSAIRTGASLSRAVKFVHQHNRLPERAWHSNALFRRSTVLARKWR